MKIIGFGLNPKQVYSTKYRLLKYKEFFKEHNICLDIKPTLEMKTFMHLYETNKLLGNLSYYGLHQFDILVSVLTSPIYDYAFVQRHLFPGSTSFLEKLLTKIAPNIIFDFDDAIFSLPKHFRPDNWRNNPAHLNELNKVNTLIKASKLVIAGNQYLKSYAEKLNKNVIVVPTPIDISNFSKPKKIYKLNSPIRIGWYGSWGNQPYLKTALPAIEKLSKRYPVKLVVISDKAFETKGVSIQNVKWNENDEERQLTNLDIAIAPLPIDEWTKGKCGYKIMKYMACGLPCVVTPIEIQKEIIDHGINGLHARNTNEWISSLECLIGSQNLRSSFGYKSREKVLNYYTREKLGLKIISAIKSIPS